MAVGVIGAFAVAVPATANDLRYLPLAAAVAQADAIVRAEILVMPDDWPTGEATTGKVKIVEALRGEHPGGSLLLDFEPIDVSVLGLKPTGEHFLLFLSRPRNSRWKLLADGTSVFSPKRAKAINHLVQATPEWSTPQRGLSTIAVPEKLVFANEEDVNLWVGYRNESAKQLILRYRTWPPEAHSLWRLDVRREGIRVAPVPHPHLTKKQISDYFSKHSHKFDLVLAPGQSYFFPIQRINSAKRGWGYKERLGFVFYPMAPGNHRILVHGYRLGVEGVHTAAPVTLRIEAKTAKE